MNPETVLYATHRDAEDWQETIITAVAGTDKEHPRLIAARTWAEGQGFTRFRVVTFGDEPPDFTRTVTL
jgi:hypothetical protein